MENATIKAYKKLATISTSSCKCRSCQSMCCRPCWGTPVDMRKIIDAGFGKALCEDTWFGDANEDNILLHVTFTILCPNLKDNPRNVMPLLPYSEEGCVFWNKGLCDLHDKGLKPLEGKIAHHNRNKDYPSAIALTWNSHEGKELIKKWREKYR